MIARAAATFRGVCLAIASVPETRRGAATTVPAAPRRRRPPARPSTVRAEHQLGRLRRSRVTPALGSAPCPGRVGPVLQEHRQQQGATGDVHEGEGGNDHGSRTVATTFLQDSHMAACAGLEAPALRHANVSVLLRKLSAGTVPRGGRVCAVRAAGATSAAYSDAPVQRLVTSGADSGATLPPWRSQRSRC